MCPAEVVVVVDLPVFRRAPVVAAVVGGVLAVGIFAATFYDIFFDTDFTSPHFFCEVV